MHYHPIIGITIFIISVIIAYYIGSYITKKYKLSKFRDEEKKDDYGDAPAPDAPWMKKNKS